ncbi:MAG: ABC transporter permease [Dehalococcoidia bacterium]
MTQSVAGQIAQPQDMVLARPRQRLRIRGLPVLLVLLSLLVLFVAAGVFAPLLAPYAPNEQSLTNRLRPPVWQDRGTWEHPLGTDNLGRDVLSRVIYGARISLIVVAVSIPGSMIFGTFLGLMAGYRRGLIDSFLMRLVDVQLALPAILFAVLLAAVYGPSLTNVLAIIVVWRWASYARLVRGEVLSLRERDFVTASRTIGASDSWIMIRHLVPNLVNAVVILATLDIATVILIEAALSFLGVGMPPPTPSWGAMVSEGRNFITVAWWLVTIPGLAILTVSLVGNLLGDWLRDLLDPRLKNIR